MTSRLFVYGTLAPGRPNEHVLAGIPGAWEPASFTGTLVHQGWGAALGFPGVIVDEHGPDRVDGFLFSSDRLDEHWQRLDEFEGDGYERVRTLVRVAEGRVEDAYVYVLRRAPDATDDPRTDRTQLTRATGPPPCGLRLRRRTRARPRRLNQFRPVAFQPL